METINKTKKQKYIIFAVFVVVFIVVMIFFDVGVSVEPRFESESDTSQQQNSLSLEEIILPSDGVTLPIKWNDFGKQMIEAGVIDAEKLESIYAKRGGLDENAKKLLYGEDNGNIKINSQNSGFILNLFWAFGLANKNSVLDEGPMQDSKYGGAGNFASTGGWSLAKDGAMEHYSKYKFVILSQEQQALVEEVSKNVYRPCCGNSTYFPDCNHGMAMLGLFELLASEGVSEEEMYKIAFQVNSYWFPDTYLTIAKYFEKQGIGWNDLNLKDVLGSAYSSGAGYQKILSEVEPPQNRGGGGCGV